MEIQPIGDMVLVECVELEQKTSNILVPSANKKEVKGTGKIIATGSGKFTDSGNVIPMRVKTGDMIIFNARAGTDIKFENKEYVLMPEAAIFAVVRK